MITICETMKIHEYSHRMSCLGGENPGIFVREGARAVIKPMFFTDILNKRLPLILDFLL